MKEQDIESFLKDLKAPAPDPAVRRRAQRAALAAVPHPDPENLIEPKGQE